ncbi:MAG TPA: extracellular solute-binding protein [Pirellulales bacterium]|nr:extracellular solute-binding protein [Pirellulales bacterium]
MNRLLTSRKSPWWLPTLFALLAGCGGDAPSGGEGETVADKDLPWKGVNLRLLIAGDSQLAEAIGRLRGEWQGATGAELDIAELTAEELLGDKPPRADAVVFPAYDLGVLVERGWLRPLPDGVLSSTELAWAEIFEADKTHDASWSATTYGFPLGSPTLLCCYRKDLLAQLNREPPTTWEEYQKLAHVLADREKLGDAAPAADAAWSGTMEPLSEGWAGLVLLARAAAYAKHRNHYSTLFDMESMDPLIAGAPFVRALDDLVAARALMPDAALTASPGDVENAVLGGRCGMAVTWTSPTFAATDEQPADKSPTAESVEIELGFVELPGSQQVFNPKTEQWDSRRDDEAPRVPLVGVSGRMAAVTADSAHPDAAFHLLGWLCGPQWSKRTSAASSATALFRRSHVEASADWADPRLGAAAALAYAEAVERALSSADLFGAPRIEGRGRYLAALDRAVRDAVEGKSNSETALAAAAKEWSRITSELGLEQQRTAYRRSLGLR